MAYDIKCRSCGAVTWADNIVNLLKEHADSTGRFLCATCQSVDTYIYRESPLQEGQGEYWRRWIKGVIRIETGGPTYSPYIFLTAESEDGPVSGLHFNYYKDTRSQQGGRLKHGHGPGGAPVLGVTDLLTVFEYLIRNNLISKDQIRHLLEMT